MLTAVDAVRLRLLDLDPDHRLTWRLVIIAVTLAGSAYFGRQPSMNVIVLLVGIAGAITFLRWPAIGLLTLVAGTLVLPIEYGTGTDSAVNFAMLLVAALTGFWILGMILHGRFRLVDASPIKPILVFVMVAIIAFVAGLKSSFAFADTASLSAQIGGLSIFVLSACAFLVAAHQIKEERWLQWLTWGFFAVGAIHVFQRILEGFSIYVPHIVIGKADGSLFWLWLPALAFGQAVFNRDLPRPVRGALIGLVAGTFFFALVLNRDWASGWLPGVAAVAFTAVAGRPRLAVPCLFLAVGLLVFKWDSISTPLAAEEGYSAMTRLEAWRILGQIIAVNPIIGLGFANYYHYTPLFPILGYSVNFSSHNNYVDIVAQTGVVGMAAFLWLMATIGSYAWRLRERVPEGFLRAYVYSGVGGLAGMLVAGVLGDWVLPFVYNISLHGFRASVLGWLFLGGLVAVDQFTARSRGTEGEQDATRLVPTVAR